MIGYEFYYDQYRRVPRNSATTQPDLLDYRSAATLTTSSIWPGTFKRTVTTTYIDGTTMFGNHRNPYQMKNLFPKSKHRMRPSVPQEKKMNTGDVYICLVPVDKPRPDTAIIPNRSEKNASPLSMTTGTHATTTLSTNLPRVFQKSADVGHRRLPSATVFDDENSEAKFYGRCATTRVNNGWVQRYKSMNETHVLTEILRGSEPQQEQILLKKRSHPQLLALCSSSNVSFASSLGKRRRAKC